MQKLFDYSDSDVFLIDFILKNDKKLNELSDLVIRCWMNDNYKEMIIEFDNHRPINKTNYVTFVPLDKSEIDNIENKLISTKHILVKELDRNGNITETYKFENKSNLIRLDSLKYYISFEFVK